MLKTLLEHEARQEAQKGQLGTAWIDSGYVFTSSIGTPIDPRNLYREFQKVCRVAGLGDWHPHELRHSAASLMLAQGVKIQVVSQVLGHSSIRMTADVYGHLLDPIDGKLPRQWARCCGTTIRARLTFEFAQVHRRSLEDYR